MSMGEALQYPPSGGGPLEASADSFNHRHKKKPWPLILKRISVLAILKLLYLAAIDDKRASPTGNGADIPGFLGFKTEAPMSYRP